MSYPNNIDNTPVLATDVNGAKLSTGDVVTGESNIRGIVIQNGLAKVDYRTPFVPGAETLAHYLSISDGSGGWTLAVSAQYGDWTYLGIGATVPYNSATVIKATRDEVEIAFVVTAFSLTSYGGGGVPYRSEIDEGLNYPISSSTSKKITATKYTKVIRMIRGEPGYYVGIHTMPRVGPSNEYIPSYNDVPDYGEWECGIGADLAVTWSSGMLTTEAYRHPDFGSEANWAAAEASYGNITDHAANMGIYDPDGTYQPLYWANAAVRATQHSQFPGRQSSDPYWSAGIPSGQNICRVMALRYPMLVQTSNNVGQLGVTRVLYWREKHTTYGTPYRFQGWIGAFSYSADSSNSYANEPTTTLRTQCASLAGGLSWPE